MELYVIDQKNMERLLSMKEAIEADKIALASWSAGRSHVPLRITFPMKEGHGISQYMPAYDTMADAVGVKIVSTYPDNIEKGLPSVPSLVVMVDSETGMPQALLNGTYLTQLRTGALAGAATELLSREDSRVFALFGTGGQAPCQLEAVLSVRPQIETVYIYGRHKERARAFVEKMKKRLDARYPVHYIVAETAEEAVCHADIITTVTTSAEPVFDGCLLKKGVHINAIGYSNPEGREIDETTVLAADHLYADTMDGVLNEVGELRLPLLEGKLARERIHELGEYILGSAEGRQSPDEITLFKSVGFGGLDVVVAKQLIEKCIQSGGCPRIEI